MVIANSAIAGGIIFATVGFAFIVKSFFGNYVESRKGYRSIIILVSSILFTLLSFLLAASGFDLDNVFEQLKMDLTPESIEKLNLLRIKLEKFMLFYIMAIIVTGTTCMFNYIMVKKENAQYQKDRKNKWNLDKLKPSTKG